MLDASPLLAIPPESVFIKTLAVKHQGGRFDAARFVDDVLAHPRIASWTLDPDVVRNAVLIDPPADYAAAVRRVFAAYAAAQGKPRYGDKTPMYVSCLPMLSGLFPESRFVHLVRDGRDVAPAFVSAPWGPSDLPEAALKWQEHVEHGLVDGRALGPDRYLEISYERLVADPEPIVRHVCEFIDVPYSDDMLHPEERAEKVIAGVPYPGSHTGIRQPITTGIRDWRRDLQPRDVELIEALVGNTITRAGYERRFDPTPLRARARARWQRVSLGVRKAKHDIPKSARLRIARLRGRKV